MKAILFAATVASLALTFSAPLQAASLTPAFTLEQMLDGSFDRRGRGCDTPQDIAEHPRCTRA